jgi:hypothetical protein
MSKRLGDENLEDQFQKKAKYDQNQENELGVASKADLPQQNTYKVSLISSDIAFYLHHLKRSQAPTCWSELPEKIWLKVFQNLEVEDVNKF